MKKFFIFFIFLSLLEPVSGQEMGIRKNNIGLNFRMNLLSPIQFSKDFEGNETHDIRSFRSVGYEGVIEYQRQLNQRVLIDFGFLVGTYTPNYKLILSEDFKDIGFPPTSLVVEGNPIPYCGISVGINHVILQNDKSSIYFGVGFNSIYVIRPESYDYFMEIADKNSEWSSVTRAKFWGDNRKYAFSPKVNLSYYRKFGERFTLVMGAVGTYSKYKILYADKFELIGDTEILTGSFFMNFAHIGLNLGGYYSF